MSKVLVTGGAGFIGSHLVDRLIEDGHDVTVLDNLEPQVHGDDSGLPDYFNHDARFIKGDVRNIDDINRALKGIDVVFHKAAMVGVGQSMYQVKKYVDVNVQGTSNLLQLIVDRKDTIEKLIVASSMSIYGEGAYSCDSCGNVSPSIRSKSQMETCDWELNCPVCGTKVKAKATPEDKPLQSTSVYAVTKKTQEELCLSVGAGYGIPTVALRYFNVYGPRQSLSNPYTGVCAIFSSRIKNDHMPIIYEDGMQSRDFISVHDIVEANIMAMNSDAFNYKALNVGTGQPMTIAEISNVLTKLYDKNLSNDIKQKFRAGDIRHCFADITNIRHVGFSPKVSFETGMKELVEWGKETEAIDNVEAAQSELRVRGLTA